MIQPLSGEMNGFDIDDVLQKATLSEKISLLAGGAFWGTQPIPRFNVPAIRVSDGPNGVRGNKFFNGVPAACLPCGTSLAATWDSALLEKAGTLIGKECIAKGVHCWLGPTANIQRSPLGGRGFESFSEDPYFSGKVASAYIRGVHSTGVSATIKHFVANDQEHERRAVNCIVSERALREIYLLPFQIALAETSPASLMTAYNKVNGVHASENKHLLQDILRGEWSQDIMVMSDWFGTYSVIEALEAGLDLEMPGPPRWRTALTEVSVSSKKMTTKTIDKRVRSMLEFIKRADQVKVAAEEGVRDLPEDRKLNRELAAEGIVLLKNDRSILPLSRASVRKIALIGPSMKQAYFSGGGSASLEPYYTVSPYQGITAAFGPDVDVQYEVGCYAHAFLPTLGPQISNRCTIKFFNKPHTASDREAVDVIKARDTNFQLMDYRHPQLERLFWATLEADLTAPSTGLYEFGVTVSGTAKLYIDGRLVVDNTQNQRPGTSFLGNGSAEERGEFDITHNKTYKVKLEFASSPTSTIKRPGVVAFPGGGARVGFALKIDEEESIKKAAQLARECDHVILCAGLSGDWESEGFDRPHMDLPGNTAKLMTAVLEANPNMVVVTQSGTPITMTPWSSLTTTHLHMWYGGNELGNGLADVLFGDCDASGRLPLTFPERVQDNPAYLNSKSENGRIIYGEDVFVGYRFYDRVEKDVMFPFGHGLSYTTFSYSDFSLSTPTASSSTTTDSSTYPKVSLQVQNTGSRSGKDVIQVYISPPETTTLNISRAPKELKGFAKVHLDPNKSTSVEIQLDKFAGAVWDEVGEYWVLEQGTYQVLVGKSSRDIVWRANWEVTEERRWNGL